LIHFEFVLVAIVEVEVNQWWRVKIITSDISTT